MKKDAMIIGALFLLIAASQIKNVAQSPISPVKEASFDQQDKRKDGNLSASRQREYENQIVIELNNSITAYKSALSFSMSIETLSKVKLVCELSVSLAKYDKKASVDHLRDIFLSLISEYKEGAKNKKSEKTLQPLREALKQLVITALRLNSKVGDQLMLVLEEVDAERLNAKPKKEQLAEKYSLAEQELETNLRKSVEHMRQVINETIPPKLPKYLEKLRLENSSLADELTKDVITLLASGRIYNSKQDLIIQAYIFREKYVSFPEEEKSVFPGLSSIDLPVGGAVPTDLAISQLGPPLSQEANLYILASLSNLDRRLTNSISFSRIEAATCIYLFSKVSLYAARYAPAILDSIKLLEGKIIQLASNHDIPEASVAHYRNMAKDVLRIGYENVLNELVKSEVEASGDPELESSHNEVEFFKDIENNKYESGEKRVDRMKDKISKEAFSDYLYFSKAHWLIRERKLDEVDGLLWKINNPNVKALAMLYILQHTSEAKDASGGGNDQRSILISSAAAFVGNKLDFSEQVQMLVGLAVLAVAINDKGNEAQSYHRMLPEIIVLLNKISTDPVFQSHTGLTNNSQDESASGAKKSTRGLYVLPYRGQDIAIFSKGIAGGAIQYSLSGTSLKTLFTKVSKADMDLALNSLRLIENDRLRMNALLGVCRTFTPSLAAQEKTKR